MGDPRERLRALAEDAMTVEAAGRGQHPGDWEPYYTVHGDPYVVERDRGMFGTVATVSTDPYDYGKARAAFMAAVDPVTVLALLDERDAALAVIKRLIGGGTPLPNHPDGPKWRHYRPKPIGRNSVAHDEVWEPMTDAECDVLALAHPEGARRVR